MRRRVRALSCADCRAVSGCVFVQCLPLPLALRLRERWRRPLITLAARTKSCAVLLRRFAAAAPFAWPWAPVPPPIPGFLHTWPHNMPQKNEKRQDGNTSSTLKNVWHQRRWCHNCCPVNVMRPPVCLARASPCARLRVAQHDVALCPQVGKRLASAWRQRGVRGKAVGARTRVRDCLCRRRGAALCRPRPHCSNTASRMLL